MLCRVPAAGSLLHACRVACSLCLPSSRSWRLARLGGVRWQCDLARLGGARWQCGRPWGLQGVSGSLESLRSLAQEDLRWRELAA